MSQKAINKKKNDVQKRSIPGRVPDDGGETTNRGYSRFVLKHNRYWDPFGSPERFKVMENTKPKSILEK